MGFLQRSSCANTTVWMHHIDADKTLGEKARQELHKNATGYIKQIQKATLP